MFTRQETCHLQADDDAIPALARAGVFYTAPCMQLTPSAGESLEGARLEGSPSGWGAALRLSDGEILAPGPFLLPGPPVQALLWSASSVRKLVWRGRNKTSKHAEHGVLPCLHPTLRVLTCPLPFRSLPPESFNNLPTRDVLTRLDWRRIDIHLHNESLATGVSFCKIPQSITC